MQTTNHSTRIVKKRGEILQVKSLSSGVKVVVSLSDPEVEVVIPYGREVLLYAVPSEDQVRFGLTQNALTSVADLPEQEGFSFGFVGLGRDKGREVYLQELSEGQVLDVSSEADEAAVYAFLPTTLPSRIYGAHAPLAAA